MVFYEKADQFRNISRDISANCDFENCLALHRQKQVCEKASRSAKLQTSKHLPSASRKTMFAANAFIFAMSAENFFSLLTIKMS